jgi:hypothetical protein
MARLQTLLMSLLFAVCLSTAGEPRPRWSSTGVIAAPEANQAAAADEQFLYAINDTQIAKYDRKTEKRLAVSSGAAKHLNSGFFWEGRLYCAHSNYPRTPELSEIKVLDTKSMELSTWRDFGNYGGSLTWAVRREGHWWCNFARYGDDNAKTFLVKFDDDWKEFTGQGIAHDPKTGGLVGIDRGKRQVVFASWMAK